MHIDSFSGAAADLPKRLRNMDNVLKALSKDPRVSVWDMEQDWLRNCLERLQQEALVILDESEPYPWLRYRLTATGKLAAEAQRRFKRPYSVRLKDGLAGARRLPANN